MAWNDVGYEHKTVARTLEEYIENFPTNRHVTVATFAGEHVTDREVRYYDGNYDQAWIAADITSFVYVNNWTVSIKSMNIGDN